MAAYGCRQSGPDAAEVPQRAQPLFLYSPQYFGWNFGDTAAQTGGRRGRRQKSRGPYGQGYTRATMVGTKGLLRHSDVMLISKSRS